MRIYIGAAMIFIPALAFLCFALYSAANGDKGAMFGIGVAAWFGAAYVLLKDMQS